MNNIRQYERQREDACIREAPKFEDQFVCVVCGGTIHLNNASHEDEDTCRDCFKDME